MNQFRSFYKVYEKGKENRKVYKGSIVSEGEMYAKYCLSTVSCFVLNDKGEILVEERTANKNISPNTLDIVSGHIDNNETPTQAMIREYVEELHNGNELEREQARNEAIQNLKKLEELYLVCEGKGYYVQYYCMKTKLEDITRQKEEVKSIKWIPREQLFEMIRKGKTGIEYDKKLEEIFRQVRESYYQERRKVVELLDVLDENGNLTGKKEDKDIIHKKGLWHREVAVLIQNEKGEYLIQKRAATKKQAPNKWGLTAGHVDAGESYEQAMAREIKEELGIEVKIENLQSLGTFKQPFESEKTTNNNFTKYYYYKTNKEIQDYTICLEELSELKYITLQELEEVIKNKDSNYSFSKRTAMEQVITLLKNIK